MDVFFCWRIWNPPLRPIIHAMMFTSDLWQYMRTAGLRLSLQLLHIRYVGEDNILPLELVGIDMLADIFVSGGWIVLVVCGRPKVAPTMLIC